MTKTQTQFNIGDRVIIKGRSGIHSVHRAWLCPTPTITNGAFVMVDTEMLKFKFGDDFFYAYAADVKRVQK
jgi:hypothetical protein